MAITQLQIKKDGLYITSKRTFTPLRNFKESTIKSTFDFAYGMTFGKTGEHRDHRTGGSHKRKNGEIFANTFQGKLAECAVCNLFWDYDKSLKPDFSQYSLGVWDTVDIEANGVKLSVKSTKSIGNLLLLETRDWDSSGRYLPTASSSTNEGAGLYDYTILVRIDPSCESLLASKRILYSDNCEETALKELILTKTWSYDFAGYVTLEELRHVISSDKYVIHKGEMLNGKTKMDADNYYIQSGDMHDCSELCEIIYPTSKSFV